MQIVITNDNKNNIYLEKAGYKVVLANDSNLRAKVESASLTFVQEHLQNKSLHGGYHFTQRVIEEDWNVQGKIGIITQTNSFRSSKPETQTLQYILPSYKLPLSPHTWQQHLQLHNHLQKCSYVKRKYKREHKQPCLTFFQRVKKNLF